MGFRAPFGRARAAVAGQSDIVDELLKAPTVASLKVPQLWVAP